MSAARSAILGRIRQGLDASVGDEKRRKAVDERLDDHPKGVLPRRGEMDIAGRVALFEAQAIGVAATVERVKKAERVPKAVSAYLKARNLAAKVRMGADERLSAMPWASERNLEILYGASDGEDEATVSHALAGIAETGTLLLASGPENPTTLNFLPDHHIVVLRAEDIGPHMEAVLGSSRQAYAGTMPRVLNFITGPSRSGDIEQKLVLGAHGPRALHIIVVET